MKLLTLNLNAKPLEQSSLKYEVIADYINEHMIDIIFLQEVAQLNGSYTISESNVLFNITANLTDNYYYQWTAIHHSYDEYVEGIAILSRYPLSEIEVHNLTKSNDFTNWKTRKLLLATAEINERKIMLGVTHTGWVDDLEEPFAYQQKQIKQALADREVILGGDFNISQTSPEFSDLLTDLSLINLTEDGYSFRTPIDGWTNVLNEVKVDYILTNKKVKLIEQKMVFNEQLVSDHNGFYCEIREEE